MLQNKLRTFGAGVKAVWSFGCGYGSPAPPTSSHNRIIDLEAAGCSALSARRYGLGLRERHAPAAVGEVDPPALESCDPVVGAQQPRQDYYYDLASGLVVLKIVARDAQEVRSAVEDEAWRVSQASTPCGAMSAAELVFIRPHSAFPGVSSGKLTNTCSGPRQLLPGLANLFRPAPRIGVARTRILSGDSLARASSSNSASALRVRSAQAVPRRASPATAAIASNRASISRRIASLCSPAMASPRSVGWAGSER
ncbi:MAG: hypothetical protein J2P53_15400 [Bradyrhizobiaceae bacterium]|nr:hypothetical protein [Bradyrhizobiaceae bacterium]